ncbi:hypothetical protein P8X24_11460 [Pyrococcus kukulkanii]|uniref:hypothetical protein n=1 Tax=Pyrococcus kukulkanii TaxID=1609559 RepID=UPI003561DDBD
MEIVGLFLASELHGESYYRKVMESFREVFPKDLVSFKDVNEVSGVDGADIVLLFLLTGGTSKKAKEVIKAGKPTILITHGKHNSLPSGLSAKAWAEANGYNVYLYHAESPEELIGLIRGLKAYKRLKGLRILEITSDGKVSENAKAFSGVFGSKVYAISYERIKEVGWSASESEIKDLLAKVRVLINAEGEKVRDVVRIYYALKKLKDEYKANAIVIDCFPFVVKYKVTPCLAVAMMNAEGIPTACEDDFHSLLMLTISYELTDSPGWIANPSGFTKNGELKLAHCTIAPTLGRNCGIVSHFESGCPYAVTCEIKYDRLIIGRVSLDYSKLSYFVARKVRSGLLEEGLCRTQLVVDIGREFLEKALGNHHVVMPYTPEALEGLKLVDWLLG